MIATTQLGYIEIPSRNNEAKEEGENSVKATFLKLASQSKITKPLQNFLNIDDILFKYVRINKDIVEIHKAENIQKLKETIIYVYLKGCRGMGKAEGHDQIFKMSIAGLESGFPFIAKSNT